MTVHIAILSVHPDALQVAKAIQFYSNPTIKIIWHMLRIISPSKSVNGNPFSGYFFISKDTVEYNTVDEIVGYMINLTEPKLAIGEHANSLVPLDGIYLHDSFQFIDTNLSVLRYDYTVTKEKVVELCERFVPGMMDISTVYYQVQQPEAHIDKPVVQQSQGRETKRIVLVISEEYNASIPGVGMYGLLENLCISLGYVCKFSGCNLLLTSESRLSTLMVDKDDLVIGLTVNGFYKGGYTNQWLGFGVSNLLHLARITKAAGARCLIVSSAHSSEFKLYGNLDDIQLLALSHIKFCGFHNYVNSVLSEKGLNTILNAFPIPFDHSSIIDQNRIAYKDKRIMFQFDTQARKYGEQILAALFDAYVLAFDQDPSVKLKVICKTTAAHGFYNSAYLDALKKDWGIHNYPGFQCSLEGRVGESWSDSIKKTDIFLALSTEEGVHYFIPEMWTGGAHIVTQTPGPCSSYLSLGESVHIVNSQEIQNSGTGFYNDNFMATVNGFNYYETVMKLKELILSPLPIASKKQQVSRHFDVDGTLLAGFLEVSPTGRKNWSVERNVPIYNRIVGSTKWPR